VLSLLSCQGIYQVERQAVAETRGTLGHAKRRRDREVWYIVVVQGAWTQETCGRVTVTRPNDRPVGSSAGCASVSATARLLTLFIGSLPHSETADGVCSQQGARQRP